MSESFFELNACNVRLLSLFNIFLEVERLQICGKCLLFTNMYGVQTFKSSLIRCLRLCFTYQIYLLILSSPGNLLLFFSQVSLNRRTYIVVSKRCQIINMQFMAVCYTNHIGVHAPVPYFHEKLNSQKRLIELILKYAENMFCTHLLVEKMYQRNQNHPSSPSW